MLLRISSSHFVAGWDLESGNCAPILNWMKCKDWGINDVCVYCLRKSWNIEII